MTDAPRTVTLTPDEVDEVAAALARYEQASAELVAAADVGIAALRDRRAARTGGRQR